MKKYHDILETKKARKAEREAARKAAAPKVEEKPAKKAPVKKKKGIVDAIKDMLD